MKWNWNTENETTERVSESDNYELAVKKIAASERIWEKEEMEWE